MNRVTYTLLLYLAFPIIFLRILWRSLRTPAYLKRWNERFGFYGTVNQFQKKKNCIVFHAVSVGEVHAALPLVEILQKECPNTSIVITTSSVTGSARVTEIFRDEIFHVYLPYDFSGAMKRFVKLTKPDLLIIMETELWPNLIHSCHQAGCKILHANARLSDKSFINYRKIPGLVRSMLEEIDLIAAQAQADGEHFLQLGLDKSKLEITGSMKFDVQLSDIQVTAGKELRQKLGIDRPVWIAASTREGEEKKIIRAFKQILTAYPDLMLLLVPRHPERFTEVSGLCKDAGLRLMRRSEQIRDFADNSAIVTKDIQVFLGDSMGEMSLLYAAADIAFVGGSLVNTGCQNILEPAALGLPIFTGPSLFNFKSSSEILINAGALKVVSNEQQLAAGLIDLLQNQEQYQAMSEAACKAVRQNRGATRKLFDLCKSLLEC